MFNQFGDAIVFCILSIDAAVTPVTIFPPGKCTRCTYDFSMYFWSTFITNSIWISRGRMPRKLSFLFRASFVSSWLGFCLPIVWRWVLFPIIIIHAIVVTWYLKVTSISNVSSTPQMWSSIVAFWSPHKSRCCCFGISFLTQCFWLPL